MHQSLVHSERTYGARREWLDVLERGQACGLHRIERLTRENALRARPRRHRLPNDRGQRSEIADNVPGWQFQADGPNQKWVADFTYIWPAEGWLYVAVLDLYARRIVGWSDAGEHDVATGGRCTDDGGLAKRQAGSATAPLGPRKSGKIQPVDATPSYSTD
jgi:transposase InsO family protein